MRKNLERELNSGYDHYVKFHVHGSEGRNDVPLFEVPAFRGLRDSHDMMGAEEAGRLELAFEGRHSHSRIGHESADFLAPRHGEKERSPFFRKAGPSGGRVDGLLNEQFSFVKYNSKMFQMYQRDMVKAAKNRENMKVLLSEQSNWLHSMKQEINKTALNLSRSSFVF